MVTRLRVYLNEKDSMLWNEQTRLEALESIPDATNGEANIGNSNLTFHNLNSSKLADLNETNRFAEISNQQNLAHPGNLPVMPSQILAPASQTKDLPLATSQFTLGAHANPRSSLKDPPTTLFPAASQGDTNKDPSNPQPAGFGASQSGLNVTAQVSRFFGRKTQLLPQISPLVHQPLQLNPYMFLLNLDDILEIYSPEERVGLSVSILEAMLRHHEEARIIYFHFKDRYASDSKDLDGEVMRLEGFWRFLREMRLETSRANIPVLNRFISRGKKNCYLIKSFPARLKNSVDQVQRRHLTTEGSGSEQGAKFSEIKEDSFDLDDKVKEAKKDRTMDMDYYQRSLSSEIDILEFMKNPQDYPEVETSNPVCFF